MIDTHVDMPGCTKIYVFKELFMTPLHTGDIPSNMGNNDDDSDAESELEYSELIFVPADPGALQTMYESLKECQVLIFNKFSLQCSIIQIYILQALNPDPENEFDYDSDELDEVYEDADEEMEDGVGQQNPSRDIGGGGDTGIVIDLT